jgi:hypothetical protein
MEQVVKVWEGMNIFYVRGWVIKGIRYCMVKRYRFKSSKA